MGSVIPDPEDVGKIFVGGLSSSTTKESLCTYFSCFGEIVDCVVMKNNETGKSRGFGFVTFKDPQCVSRVLDVKYHELDGKKIDPKECTPRSMQKVRKQVGKCKVFLGGLPPNITEEAIRNGMSKFGKVDQVVIMYDQDTKKCRGFGFLSFELEESIEQACAERYVIISGKQVECKKAEPRINPRSLSQAFDFSKNQNGYLKSLQFDQMTAVHQNNWSIPINQTLLSLQGSPYPNYASYSTTPSLSPTNSVTSAGYTSVQPMSYLPQFAPIYGTALAYTSIPANTYGQSNFTNSQTVDVSGQNNTASETTKSYALNDYSSTTHSSYGPLKVVGNNAADVTYSTQTAASASNPQRFHPYKSLVLR